MATTKKKTSRTVARTWLIRLGIALGVGLLVGASAGVVTVNSLEPGRPNSVDSLQVMLDSIAGGRLPKQANADPIDSAIAAAEADAQREANDTTLITVPSLLDLEEGDARNTIFDAGLQVGEVQFQSSPKPAGIVLATFPVSGARVVARTAITLVLSDGRPPVDTMSTR
ncbi:MAG: PASTA domain-containing protein [Gemmatimonadaceae bacterium]|nr:PASTA domain-containing protein [Gemmatimonadaceae bacterium]